MKSRRQLRLDRLAEALTSGPSLHLKDAAELLGVSEMTVRRDIAASDGGFSYLGGYIVAVQDSSSSLDYFLGREEFTNVQAKREACANALTLIENKDILFLDCGTTLPYLAQALPADLSLTVICYSVNIAEIVCKKPNLKVIMLGGEYHPASASFASDEAIDMLNNMGITKAFISIGGVHFQNGLSCSNFHEVRIKQTAMARAETCIGIVDSSKIGAIKAATFAAIDDVQVIATDSGIAADDLQRLQDANLTVLH